MCHILSLQFAPKFEGWNDRVIILEIIYPYNYDSVPRLRTVHFIIRSLLVSLEGTIGLPSIRPSIPPVDFQTFPHTL